MFLAAKMMGIMMRTRLLLCVLRIVATTRILRLVGDFTSVPLTARRIAASVPMDCIGTTRKSKISHFLIPVQKITGSSTAMQLDTLKLDTLKRLSALNSNQLQSFYFQKLQQIYSSELTSLLPWKTIIFKVLFTECVHFTAILFMFFSATVS